MTFRGKGINHKNEIAEEQEIPKKINNSILNLNSEHPGKCLRICSATETLAASINSSTIWFASRI